MSGPPCPLPPAPHRYTDSQVVPGGTVKYCSLPVNTKVVSVPHGRVGGTVGEGLGVAEGMGVVLGVGVRAPPWYTYTPPLLTPVPAEGAEMPVNHPVGEMVMAAPKPSVGDTMGYRGVAVRVMVPMKVKPPAPFSTWRAHMDMLSAAQRSVVPTTFIPLVWTHAHPLVGQWRSS